MGHRSAQISAWGVSLRRSLLGQPSAQISGRARPLRKALLERPFVKKPCLSYFFLESVLRIDLITQIYCFCVQIFTWGPCLCKCWLWNCSGVQIIVSGTSLRNSLLGRPLRNRLPGASLSKRILVWGHLCAQRLLRRPCAHMFAGGAALCANPGLGRLSAQIPVWSSPLHRFLLRGGSLCVNLCLGHLSGVFVPIAARGASLHNLLLGSFLCADLGLGHLSAQVFAGHLSAHIPLYAQIF